MLRSQFLLIFLIIKIFSCLGFIQRRLEDNEDLKYNVILSEPLQSTLEWDNDVLDKTKLIFRWNITLSNGYGGILAFSNHDSNTDNLDVILFGNDRKIYNAYTDENSLLTLPERYIRLSYNVLSAENIDKQRKTVFSIRIIRPLDTCDKQKRNYIIDSGTTHLLTGLLKGEDFQKFKQGKSIEMDIERMNLTLQRVQLLKSQVNFKF